MILQICFGAVLVMLVSDSFFPSSANHSHSSSMTTGLSIRARSHFRILSGLRPHRSSVRQLPQYGLAFHTLVACNNCRRRYIVRLVAHIKFSTEHFESEKPACILQDGLWRRVILI